MRIRHQPVNSHQYRHRSHQKTKLQAAKQDKVRALARQKDSKNKIDRDLVKWTRAVAFLTGGLILTGVFQFGAALLQWDSMRSAGVDSSNLVTATNKLVAAYGAQETETQKLRTATENFAKAMRDEAANTGRLVGEAHELRNSHAKHLVLSKVSLKKPVQLIVRSSLSTKKCPASRLSMRP